MDDRTQLLLDGAKGLKSLAEALESLADMMRRHDFDPLIRHKEEQPELFGQPTDTAEVKPVEIPLTLVDVRRILAEKSRAGHTDQVRLLLEKYGADRLSAIDPSHYRNLADEAHCLGATLDDLKAAIDGKAKEGMSDRFAGVFEHHYATSLEDLDPTYYPGFLRDIRRLGDE
jgi:hypothetical protein